MKKILLMILCLLILIMPVTLTGCNKQVFDTNYTFTKAHIKIDEEWFDVDIVKWNDYDGEQIQIKLTDGTVLLLSSYNCILYKGTLPSKQ